MNDADGSGVQPSQVSVNDVLSRGLREKNHAHTKQRALAFKVTHVLLSTFFLWLFIIHGVGLFFFTKGFLLTRLVLDNQSQCSILPDGSPSSVENGCWHPREFEKAVVIVIDALRYDFTVPFQASADNIAPSHYHNNFPILYNTAVQQPEHAFLLPFIADPPTSTLQRLKALTAGNLPTFIDIGSSFGGSATAEDNILVQLNKTNKNIVHLGDDTWHSLFPGYFDQDLTHAYDSFNVWDLHTVDNGVIEHILPLLQDANKSRWDVLFAHFLGVDHAGHRYGPDHQAMADKLQQMDRVLRDIMINIDDKTLLVVLGDHGMDPKGDHGGESDEEVESTLWMYSKKPKFGRTDPSHVKPPATAKDRPVEQIDLVSTLSLLLGLPVPFNNLGTPIAEAFIGSDKYNPKNLATVNLLVFDQIQRYQDEYVKARDLEADDQQVLALERLLRARSNSSEEGWHVLNTAYGDWHKNTIGMYRKLWANFDTTDMICGVLLSGLGLVTQLLFYMSASHETTDSLPKVLRNIGLASVVGGSTGSLVSSFIPSLGIRTGGLYSASISGVVYSIYFSLTTKQISASLHTSIWSWLAVLFTMTQAAGFASNSYTIHEDTILLLFLTTFGVMTLLSSLRQASKSDQILGSYHSILFIFLARTASYSRLCREEQMPGCRSTFYASQTSSTSAPWQLAIPFAIALVLPEIIKAFYKGTASYAGSAGFWIGFSLRMGLLFVAAYWTIDTADNANWLATHFSGSTIKTVEITLARCALAVAIPIGVGTFIWAKPCIDISISPTSQLQQADGMQPQRPQITILGYANAFGTRYFLIVPIFTLSTILLLPPMGQFSFALLTWQILCLLEILDTNGLITNSSTSSLIGPIMLAILGSFHFFKTGHQAVLSSIQWNAAFVPFRTVTYPFAPLLVLLNTYGAQILCAVAVPLTVLWKRPIDNNGLRGIWTDVAKACLAHVLYYATIQLATTMWAGHLRRHLMLYRVFMPRFLMASTVLLTIDLVLIIVSLTSVRITGDSVAEIFGY